MPVVARPPSSDRLVETPASDRGDDATVTFVARYVPRPVDAEDAPGDPPRESRPRFLDRLRDSRSKPSDGLVAEEAADAPPEDAAAEEAEVTIVTRPSTLEPPAKAENPAAPAPMRRFLKALSGN